MVKDKHDKQEKLYIYNQLSGSEIRDTNRHSKISFLIYLFVCLLSSISLYEPISVEMFMKMKIQPLNYDISFYSSISFISSDLPCNLILIIYIYSFKLRWKRLESFWLSFLPNLQCFTLNKFLTFPFLFALSARHRFLLLALTHMT